MTFAAVMCVAAPEILAVFFPDYRDGVTAIRVMGVVAVFRAVGYVIPPLLDGVGQPQRTLRYMTWAAITLPLAFVVGANVLGHKFNYLSVAIAWAVGYPIAFAVLISLAMSTLEWSALAFFRRIGGVIVCIGAAAIVGAAIQSMTGTLAPVVRLVITSIVIAGTTLVLLAYTQGLSPRTVIRALRGTG
jgi:O-antigen/teichoic acid export membrane protein